MNWQESYPGLFLVLLAEGGGTQAAYCLFSTKNKPRALKTLKNIFSISHINLPFFFFFCFTLILIFNWLMIGLQYWFDYLSFFLLVSLHISEYECKMSQVLLGSNHGSYAQRALLSDVFYLSCYFPVKLGYSLVCVEIILWIKDS